MTDAERGLLTLAVNAAANVLERRDGDSITPLRPCQIKPMPNFIGVMVATMKLDDGSMLQVLHTAK